MDQVEEKRRELNNLQKDVVALISDLSDLETRFEGIRKKSIELYENNNAKLDTERTEK